MAESYLKNKVRIKKQSKKYFEQRSFFLSTGNSFTLDHKNPKRRALDSHTQEIKGGRAIFFKQLGSNKSECEANRVAVQGEYVNNYHYLRSESGQQCCQSHKTAARADLCGR